MFLRNNEMVRSLIGVYVPSVVMSLGLSLVVPIVPVLAAEFDITPGLAAQIVTATGLGRFLIMFPSGLTVDRFGTKPAMLVGSSVLAVACLASAAAPTFWFLLLAQAIASAGATLWQTGREISAIELVQPDQRGRLMSGLFGFGFVGIAIGPMVGAVAISLFNFRVAFLIYVVVALVVLAISLTIPSVKPRTSGGRGLKALFDFGGIKEIDPFYRASFVVIIMSSFVDFAYRMMANSLLPLYIVLQRGFSSTQLGSLYVLMGAINVALILPTGLISDKIGRKAAAVPSAALLALAYFTFPLATSMVLLSLVCVISATGQGLSNGSKATYSYDVIPESARGRLQALRRTVGEVGGISGPLVSGFIADRSAPSTAFWVFAPFQVVSTLLLLFLCKETVGRWRDRKPGEMVRQEA